MIVEHARLLHLALKSGGQAFSAKPGTYQDRTWAELCNVGLAVLRRVPREGEPVNLYSIPADVAEDLRSRW